MADVEPVAMIVLPTSIVSMVDGTGFAAFAGLPSTFEAKPWLRPVSVALPMVTAGAYGAGEVGAVPGSAWLLPLCIQIVVLSLSGRAIKDA